MKRALIAFATFCIAFFVAMTLMLESSEQDSLPLELGEQHWYGQIETAGGTYDGTLLGDYFEGRGNFRFINGEAYAGTWEDSYMSGEGTLTYPEVGTYSGEMSSSVRSGHGVFTWDTGDIYEGQWSDDLMSGEGEYRFADGSVFKGEFVDNQPISGTYTYSKAADSSLKGSDITFLKYELGDNDASGHIVFKTKAGLSFDGDASGLSDEGAASITYPSGNSYIGILSKGKRSGTGKYVWKNTSGKTVRYYKGSWSKDRMSGEGEYHFTAKKYPYLSGSFKNNVPIGSLTYYKAANNTFITTWKSGSFVKAKEQ